MSYQAGGPGSNVQPYPNMFDPTQMSNQFSAYNNQSFPVGNYSGVPVNAATGQPITSYQAPPTVPSQGTTLNTSPNQAQWGINNSMINAMGQGGTSADMSNAVNMRSQNDAAYGMQQPYGGPVLQSNAPPGSATNTNSALANISSPSSNAYLEALANPGNPVEQGINISGSYQPGSSDFSQILASLQASKGSQMQAAPPPGIGGGSSGLSYGGTGSGNAFLTALAALRGSGTTGAAGGGTAGPVGGGSGGR
jgi:hypothetical protein